MRTSFISLAPLALAACMTTPAEPPSEDGLAYAGLGQTVRVGGLGVTPLKVIEDSRCPINARCVWAGQVRISVQIATSQGILVHEIVANKPLALADGTLTLANVEPSRRTDAILHPSQYRFGFGFSRGLRK